MKNEYTRPEYYENRELSWLGFDERILSEARDKSIPLFERLKFLSITASNLDEFFMVRVASLLDMVNAEYKGKDIAGMNAREQLDAIHDRVHEFVNVQYSTWQRSLLPHSFSSEVRRDSTFYLQSEETVWKNLLPWVSALGTHFP